MPDCPVSARPTDRALLLDAITELAAARTVLQGEGVWTDRERMNLACGYVVKALDLVRNTDAVTIIEFPAAVS